MFRGPVWQTMLVMTSPTVIEIRVKLAAVEHDDFIDRLESVAPVAPRPATPARRQA